MHVNAFDVNKEIVHRPDFRTKSKKNRAAEWLMYDELEKRRDVTPAQKLVAKLLTGLVVSQDGKQVHAFEAWIGKATGLSLSTVRRAVTALESCGYLVVARNRGGFARDEEGRLRGRANGYSLNPEYQSKMTPDAIQDDTRPPLKMNGDRLSKCTTYSSLTHLEQTESTELVESQSEPTEPESSSPPERDSDGKKESKAEILSKTISREDSVRWSRMLADEREYGRWRFEREPKCYIPKEFIDEWERRNPITGELVSKARSDEHAKVLVGKALAQVQGFEPEAKLPDGRYAEVAFAEMLPGKWLDILKGRCRRGILTLEAVEKAATESGLPRAEADKVAA